MAGDVFQLGNASWRVVQVAAGTVRMSDAQGVPPNIPFWFGEAPARSDELSRAVSELRSDCEQVLAPAIARAAGDPSQLVRWLVDETGIDRGAADQLAAYFVDGYQALGVIPTQETLVLERFFDES